jgi:hypothetical protein
MVCIGIAETNASQRGLGYTYKAGGSDLEFVISLAIVNPLIIVWLRQGSQAA